MRLAPACLLVLAALRPAPAEASWLCWAPLEAGALHGALFRRVGHDGRPDGRLHIQLSTAAAPGDERMISWQVADPLGYPFDPLYGRPPPPEERAFREGPSVSLSHDWRGVADGPIWAYYYGDGELAGAALIATRFRLRRSLRAGEMGIRQPVADRAILARLAAARAWTVIVADASGRALSRETILIPHAAEIEAAYRRAKPELDRMTAAFRTACSDEDQDGPVL